MNTFNTTSPSVSMAAIVFVLSGVLDFSGKTRMEKVTLLLYRSCICQNKLMRRVIAGISISSSKLLGTTNRVVVGQLSSLRANFNSAFRTSVVALPAALPLLPYQLCLLCFRHHFCEICQKKLSGGE